MPTTLAIRSSACSRGIRANPKVPVGPVTATVRSLSPPRTGSGWLDPGPCAPAVMPSPCQTHGRAATGGPHQGPKVLAVRTSDPGEEAAGRATMLVRDVLGVAEPGVRERRGGACRGRGGGQGRADPPGAPLR